MASGPEFEIQIDWALDRVLIFYGDTFFEAQHWSTDNETFNPFLGNLDLFHSSGTRVYWDDLSVEASEVCDEVDVSLACLTLERDENDCATFLWKTTNRNLCENIAEFYLDIEAGAGGTNETCRGAAGSTTAIEPPPGWSVTNCTNWGVGQDKGHVLFRFKADTPLDEFAPGETVQGRLTVDTNIGRAFTTTRTGVTVPAFSIVMTAAQRRRNEVSIVCAPGDYSFGPTVDPTQQAWTGPATCTALLNVPATSRSARALLTVLLLMGGALLVLRSRRSYPTSS